MRSLMYRNRSSKKTKVVKADPGIVKKTGNYQREQRHPSGPAWERKKANVIAHHRGICGLCDHPGVLPKGQVDHKIVDYPLDNSLSNLLPVHGSSNTQKNPCPVCELNCNQVRAGLSFEAGRAKIARRLAAKGITPQVKGIAPDDGREW